MMEDVKTFIADKTNSYWCISCFKKYLNEIGVEI